MEPRVAKAHDRRPVQPARSMVGILRSPVTLLVRRWSARSTIVRAVVGMFANGAVIRLRVLDIGAGAGYTTKVREVADHEDVLRTSLRITRSR